MFSVGTYGLLCNDEVVCPLDPINECAMTAISSIISSAAIGKVGYYQPFLWSGAVLATVGSALIYTLQISSPAAHYIGYQVIAGIGIGAAIQAPFIVAQRISSRADMAVTVSLALCKLLNRLG